ncbi:MAG: DUF350 domain-containing protein [Crocinitomicaceae bacterium]|nr:DUF350 domain-containing protein [Crocinitomicaceae bacterium]
MENNFEFIWHSGLFLVLCLVLFFVAKITFRLFNSSIKINEELTEKDNLGFYMGYIGYFVGFLMIIGGVMNSEGSGEFWSEVMYSVIYGLIGILLLNITSLILDKIIHPKVKLWTEVISKGNISIGILKGSHYFSTGIIISAVMLTEVNKPFEAAVFLVFALIIGSLGFMFYNFITPFNVRKEIYEGNAAVAVSTMGAQIAFAILIYSGFQIVHTTWQESFMNIGIDILIGFLIIPLIRLIVDKVFIPNRKLTDEIVNQENPNVGAGIFEALSYIGGALLFVWCWNL